PAHVPGDHGAAVRGHRQDHPGSGQRGHSLPAARPAHATLADPGDATGVAADGRRPMRLNLAGGVIAALIVVALIIAYGALFTVYQTRQALVVRLGQPVRVVTEPGLHSKIPLIDSVISIDK